MDHLVSASEISKGLNGEAYGLCMLDLGTEYRDLFPSVTRKAEKVQQQTEEFYGDVAKNEIRSDGAQEFRKAMTNLFVPHVTSTPGRHESNAIAERNVQTLSQCVRALLEQSGLEHSYWPLAGRFAAFALNNHKDDFDGKTPWERRHGTPFEGPFIPFGSLVSFIPSPTAPDAKRKLDGTSQQGVSWATRSSLVEMDQRCLLREP